LEPKGKVEYSGTFTIIDSEILFEFYGKGSRSMPFEINDSYLKIIDPGSKGWVLLNKMDPSSHYP
jgi:hypothetical protein